MPFQKLDAAILQPHAEAGKAFEYDGKGHMNLEVPAPAKGSWKPAPRPLVSECAGIPGIYMKRNGKAFKWEFPREQPDRSRQWARTVDAPRKGVPYSKVGPVATDGFSQNNHMWWMKKDPGVDAFAFGVGMNLHMIAYAKGNAGKAVASKDHLKVITRLSAEAAIKRANLLVERGWFKRIDNGKGGRDGRNIATYVPTVPEHVLAKGGY